MEKTQWARIKELFGAALDLDPGEREVFLRQACGQDENLRAEVESLLANHELPDILAENPWPEHLLKEIQAPESIGPYQLVKKIGAGGMGEVWLAEQTAPVRRQVALKLIRSGLYDDILLQRFQSERQSLAIMDHPAIARVFEAGSAANGQPYFVMEYVHGIPITDYCEQKKLTVRERLELFIKVCEGVQHAHQKAILHRDLKPANILVIEVDGKPAPKIIDFGLAKAAAPIAEDKTALLTLAGSFLGTPSYMSPEQASPDIQDTDTRTDVYSLGVVLYVLLTGALPFDAKRKPLHEILRQLREEEPPRPSLRVVQKRQSPGTGDSKQLANMLRGDLDWITMKALEKDRARRYGTPLELAADIDRYLKYEPVIARPASTGYRLQRYVRRHRVGVAVASGLMFLLAGFAVLQAIQLRRITRERDRADRVTEFITTMFKVSDPGEARGNTITAREILDRSAREVDSGLAQDPELRARMLSVMATVYQNLGLDSRAESLLQRAIELRTRSLGPKDLETLKLQGQMGSVLTALARYAEAEKLDRDLLEVERHNLGLEHRETLTTQRNFFWLLNAEGHAAEAEQLGRETLAVQQRTLGNEDPDTLLTMRQLGSIMERADHLPAAEALIRQIIEIRKRVSGADHPQTLVALSDLARILSQEGRDAEAEAVYRPTLDAQQQVLGPDHQDSIATMAGLGATLRRQHKLDEAERFTQQALDLSSRALGPEHPTTIIEMGNLALILQERRKYPEAERLQRQVVEMSRRTLGAEHVHTTIAMEHLGEVLHLEGRDAESVAMFRETAAIQRRALGTTHRYTLNTLYNLACALAADHRPAEAVSVLREVVDAGFATAADLESDSDLKPLRGHADFNALLQRTPQHF